MQGPEIEKYQRASVGQPDEIDSILEKYRGRKDALVPALYDIHKIMNHLPESAAIKVAEALEVPVSKVYGVATFYTLFSVRPKGKHVIRVCESAPCHVLGAMDILGALERELGIKAGDTTKDGRFTLELTSCLGTCGVAPAIMIDDVVYGNLTIDKIPHILSEYR